MSADVPERSRARLLWPDLAKGLCILLVVLHHTVTKHYLGLVPAQIQWIADGWVGLSHLLKPLRMPLFFVIAGLFASSALVRPWREVARRMISPYYLYVVWLVVLAVIFAVERTLPMNRTQDLVELAVDLVLASTAMWFLYALAVYFLLAKLLLPLPVAWVLVPAAVLTASASALPFGEVNRVSVFVHFTYFVLGSRCPDLVWTLARTPRRRLLPALALGYVALATLLTVVGASSGIRLLLLSAIGVPAGLVAAVILSGWDDVARPLSWLGRRTLPIYVLHVPLLGLLHHLPVSFTSATGWTAAVLALAYPLLATVGIAVGCLLVNRALVWAGLGSLFELPTLRSNVDSDRPSRPAPQVSSLPRNDIAATGSPQIERVAR